MAQEFVVVPKRGDFKESLYTKKSSLRITRDIRHQITELDKVLDDGINFNNKQVAYHNTILLQATAAKDTWKANKHADDIKKCAGAKRKFESLKGCLKTASCDIENKRIMMDASKRLKKIGDDFQELTKGKLSTDAEKNFSDVVHTLGNISGIQEFVQELKGHDKFPIPTIDDILNFAQKHVDENIDNDGSETPQLGLTFLTVPAIQAGGPQSSSGITETYASSKDSGVLTGAIDVQPPPLSPQDGSETPQPESSFLTVPAIQAGLVQASSGTTEAHASSKDSSVPTGAIDVQPPPLSPQAATD